MGIGQEAILTDVRSVYKLQRASEFAEDAMRRAFDEAQQVIKDGAVINPADFARKEIEAYEVAREAEQVVQREIGGKVFRVANLGSLTKKIEKLQRKAEKLGSGEITYVISGETDTEWRPVDEGQWGIGFNSQDPQASLCAIYKITYTYVIVSGSAPKLPGYEFLATVEHTPAGNIVREVPVWNQEALTSEYGREFDSRDYRFVDATCVHCGLDRRRKDTFIVREEATGQMMQVGRNCLADFTGINDPMKAAKGAEWFRDFFAAGDDEDMDEVRAGAREESGFGVEEFLAQAAAFVRTQGYKKAGWDGATGEAAWYSLMNYGKTDPKTSRPLYLEIEEVDRNTAARVYEWVAGIDAYTPNDYLSNVRVAVLSGLITWRRKGIAASAVAAFERDETKRVEKELAESRPEIVRSFIGEPKERLRNVPLTVTFRKFIESTYDNPYSKTILKFEDESGNVVTWFASDEPWLDTVVKWDKENMSDMEHVQKWQRPLRVGDKITATFTVKKHEDSERFGKATIVNRLVLDSFVSEGAEDNA